MPFLGPYPQGQRRVELAQNRTVAGVVKAVARANAIDEIVDKLAVKLKFARTVGGQSYSALGGQSAVEEVAGRRLRSERITSSKRPAQPSRS